MPANGRQDLIRRLKVKWRYLLRVLCPVRMPITTLDCVLLRNKNLVLAPGHGPEINSWACCWVLPRPHHLAHCWLTNQWLIFLLIFCLETPKAASRQTDFWTELSLVSLSAISFPCTPACPGTQYKSTACQVEISFSAFWHCCTNGDIVLVAWTAFRAAWLSEQILTCFSGLPCNWISWAEAKIAYISAWKSVVCLPREILSLLAPPSTEVRNAYIPVIISLKFRFCSVAGNY